MTQGLALRRPQPENYAEVEPCLQLLIEGEPAYRVFWGNLLALILRRKEPPLFLASQPIHCRRNLYVRTGVRWPVLVESMAWHLAATPLLLVLWTLSMQWDSVRFPFRHVQMAQRHYQLTYPAPKEAFPAREGRQHAAPTQKRSARSVQPSLKVAAETRRPAVDAPEVNAGGGKRPAEFASANPTLPPVPLSATARSQLVLPADFAKVIGPAPSAGHLSLRAFGAPDASVVAPPPKIAGGSRQGGELTLPTAVVAPSPELAGGGAMGVPARVAQGFGMGGLGALATAVVPPPPSIRGRAFIAGGLGTSGGGTGPEVVAPSPALSHGLVLAGGRGNSLAGAGTQVVPPAPALRGHGFRSGGNGGHSVGGSGTQVVPPSPSISGTGALGGGNGNRPGLAGGSAVPPAPAGSFPAHGGYGHGTGNGSVPGGGTEVVAPAPMIASSRVGHGGGGNGGTSFADLGAQALPPSVGTGGQSSGNGVSGTGSQTSGGSPEGMGAGGSGKGSASSSNGSETVAGLVGGAGTGAQPGQSSVPIISTAIPKHPEIPDLPAGKTEVVPLRVVQLALALPMSSFFSNYEAFVAERAVNRETTQLIKLVYIFLPYQRRLTELGVNTSKKFNLRVTRDPSCDESLISMTWPEGEAKGKPAESDKNKLPCYRTTADDYRRAWEKAR